MYVTYQYQHSLYSFAIYLHLSGTNANMMQCWMLLHTMKYQDYLCQLHYMGAFTYWPVEQKWCHYCDFWSLQWQIVKKPKMNMLVFDWQHVHIVNPLPITTECYLGHLKTGFLLIIFISPFSVSTSSSDTSIMVYWYITCSSMELI